MNQTDSFRIPVIDIDAHPPLCPMSVDYIDRIDADIFFARLNRAGIDIACGSLTPPPDFLKTHTPEEAVTLLNRGAMALSAADSRYLPALRIHPDCPDFSISQLDEYAPLGVRLIDIDGCHLPHPSMKAILTRAQSLNMTVSLYGENIAQAKEMAEQFPNLRILMGGLGSLRYMPNRAFSLMQTYPNLFLNLSGTVWTFNYSLHEWAQRFGINRLFFGSGYPSCNPAGKLAAVRWELRDQPVSVFERILCKNALGLLDAEGRLQ